MSSRFLLPWLGACLVIAFSAVRAQEVVVAPSARDWSMPIFSKEGYHTMTLSGTSVRPVTSDQIDVVGMNFVTYSGGADPKVDTVLLSPSATFFLNEKIARGPGPVRMTRDDVDATGEDWVYHASQKKVSLARHTRIVFRQPLPDLIK